MSYSWERRSGASCSLVAVVGLGILAGVAAAAVFASPRIAARSPAAGAAGISSLSPITITFSQPVDPAAAQARVSLAPPTAGSFEAADDGRTLRFIPRQAWPDGATVVVSVAAGARSRLGLPMLLEETWQFTVGEPRVAYLAEASGVANVWSLRPGAEAEAAQVTNHPGGVLDFVASPDGTQLVYAAVRADGGSDLRAMDLDGSGDALMLECPGEICRAPQPSPGGDYLAFERWPLLSIAVGQSPARESHVWLLDLAGREAQALEPGQDTTIAPRWSPDGQRLAYYDLSAQQIIVYDLGARDVLRIANTSGEMGAWTPDSLSLVFPEIVFAAEAPAVPQPPTVPTVTPAGQAPVGLPGFYSHLVRVEIESRARQELSAEAQVEDAAAMPAPDNSWIAFGRKYLDSARWTPGRQLWLMRPDGSDAHALTHDGDFQHSAFAWSPDGRRLAYTRYNVAAAGARPEIWTISADGTDARLLAAGGYVPIWLP